MKVFKYSGCQEPYANFSTAETDQLLWARELNGDKKASGWHPVQLYPAEDYRGQPKALGPIADVTTVNAAVRNCVWGPRARAVLEPLVKPFGEFLPLRCNEADWVLFNVTHTIDALDEQASEIVYVNDPDRKVLRFVKMVFKPEWVEGEVIFRIPQRNRGDVFVTDRFAQLLAQQGLVGFNLKPVWDSESEIRHGA
jgi:hypothetical protein